MDLLSNDPVMLLVDFASFEATVTTIKVSADSRHVLNDATFIGPG